uniref:Uncharacterized protein MANES_03G192500 n=2 Tax=Rhizophora mucronata TaxID=61149 RepID=A0A2P2MI48_RHIMU
MDRYGRTQGGSQSDPSPEWNAPGPETGLEERVWQLGLEERESGYPERPNGADCIYYLRTGFCGYGARCRFNHPRDRGAVLGAARTSGGEYPERVGQPVCQHYLRTGTCKFGASCKYHHPKLGGGPVSPVPLNYYGYPLRLGEKECTYYIKTGKCKFGATCKFHHPLPANIQVPSQSLIPQVSPSLYAPAQSLSGPSSQQYGLVVARPPLLPGYVQGSYGSVLLSPSVVTYPSWNPYPAPVSLGASSSTQPTVGSSLVYGTRQLSPSAPAYTGAHQPIPTTIGPSSSSQKEHLFPERPGHPECQYYMKTGDCKFGSSCRYHHPPELVAPKANVALSPMGLPLRPGTAPCMHYAQRGQCKFGPACKFDHPMGTLSYSPSASSLTDMPVAPYPAGSSVGMLAPSSSSSELRPQLIAGSSKESSSTIMSSTMSSSSGSVGLAFAKSGPAIHSSAQQSGQSSGSSSGGSSSNAEAQISS